MVKIMLIFGFYADLLPPEHDIDKGYPSPFTCEASLENCITILIPPYICYLS